MTVEKMQRSNEKKLTLLLLCWLFGLFAVHRFYTGKYLTGALQLLVLTLGGVLAVFEAEIPTALCILTLALWWVVDIARIIMGKFTDKEGRLIVDWV
jgi:TM2 domain-containing membrane protein YozV